MYRGKFRVVLKSNPTCENSWPLSCHFTRAAAERMARKCNSENRTPEDDKDPFIVVEIKYADQDSIFIEEKNALR